MSALVDLSLLAGFGTVRLATVLTALSLLGLALLPGGMAARPAGEANRLAAHRLGATQIVALPALRVTLNGPPLVPGPITR